MNGNGSNGTNPVGQAVEVFVYAPIGLALMAWKTLPKLVGDVVSRGCAQLGEAEDRLANTVNQARMIGQMAVAYGGHQVRREVDSRLADARRRADVLTGRNFRPDVAERAPRTAPPPPAPQASPAPEAPPRAEAPAPAEPVPGPRAQDLPIPEYDGLSASQVVQRLAGLSPDELAAVRAYEVGGRGRKTVLAAIDRLTR